MKNFTKDLLEVLGIEEEVKCTTCGCPGGIHKSDCIQLPKR